MLKPLLTAWIVVASIVPLVSLSNINAAELPDRIQAGDHELILNGSGTRNKYLMQLYAGGLYLTQPSSDARAIITADNPMAIRLEIKSGFVSQAKLVDSLNEGFRNSTNGNQLAIQAEIDRFRQCFSDPITKGDVFELVYLPATGVIVLKNGSQCGAVEGLAFKQALFGIWLSDRPADESLKRAMLRARTARDSGRDVR